MIVIFVILTPAIFGRLQAVQALSASLHPLWTNAHIPWMKGDVWLQADNVLLEKICTVVTMMLRWERMVMISDRRKEQQRWCPWGWGCCWNMLSSALAFGLLVNFTRSQLCVDGAISLCSHCKEQRCEQVLGNFLHDGLDVFGQRMS